MTETACAARDITRAFRTAGEGSLPTLEQQRAALLARQAERISVLQEEISQRQEEVDRLKTCILEEHPEPGSYTAGTLTVTVKPGRRGIDAKTLTKRYPAARHPDMYAVKPKSLSELVRLVGEPAIADCITHAKPSVTVS